MKILKFLVIFIIVNLSFIAVAQDENAESEVKDAEKAEISEAEKAWTEINELLVQRQNQKDEEYKKHSE